MFKQLLVLGSLWLIVGTAPPPGVAQAVVPVAPTQQDAVVRAASTPLAPSMIPAADAVPWTVVVEEPFWFGSTIGKDYPPAVTTIVLLLYAIIFVICVYTVRHYWFTFNRLFGHQRHPYSTLDTTEWPTITILIPAHNEEAVITTILDALVKVDYPHEKLHIMPVNDRSEDWTEEIVNMYAKWAREFPGQIIPFHRKDGKPGKAAALKDALDHVETELMLIFDADYVPGGDLIKQLVAPFLDPEVGAVMGRVVPVNTDRNLLTRMLDMERAGGYQVDQQARMNMHLIPQYGGTVGGVRRAALRSVGGWREDSLAEDTDITCRLAMNGWKVVYSNRYECYEEVPETWPVRIRQIMRWAKGHTDAALRYSHRMATSKHLRWRERLDGVLLLGVYLMSPLLLVGWACTIILFYLGVHSLQGLIAILAVASYNTVGNFAAFYEIATAVRIDGTRSRIRLLPFVIVGFIVSLLSVSRATLSQLLPRSRRKPIVWHKTRRFRKEDAYDDVLEEARTEAQPSRPTGLRKVELPTPAHDRAPQQPNPDRQPAWPSPTATPVETPADPSVAEETTSTPPPTTANDTPADAPTGTTTPASAAPEPSPADPKAASADPPSTAATPEAATWTALSDVDTDEAPAHPPPEAPATWTALSDVDSDADLTAEGTPAEEAAKDVAASITPETSAPEALTPEALAEAVAAGGNVDVSVTADHNEPEQSVQPGSEKASPAEWQSLASVDGEVADAPDALAAGEAAPAPAESKVTPQVTETPPRSPVQPAPAATGGANRDPAVGPVSDRDPQEPSPDRSPVWPEPREKKDPASTKPADATRQEPPDAVKPGELLPRGERPPEPPTRDRTRTAQRTQNKE